MSSSKGLKKGQAWRRMTFTLRKWHNNPLLSEGSSTYLSTAELQKVGCTTLTNTLLVSVIDACFAIGAKWTDCGQIGATAKTLVFLLWPNTLMQLGDTVYQVAVQALNVPVSIFLESLAFHRKPKFFVMPSLFFLTVIIKHLPPQNSDARSHRHASPPPSPPVLSTRKPHTSMQTEPYR